MQKGACRPPVLPGHLRSLTPCVKPYSLIELLAALSATVMPAGFLGWLF